MTHWPVWALIGGVAAGVSGVVFGAKLLVDGAVDLALFMGVSKATIGLTLVAVGTSLPELATAVVAARRGHTELAVGNIIGANAFNVLGIIGVIALLTPLSIPMAIARFDMWVMLGVTLAFLAALAWRRSIGRGVALLMLAAYAAYVTAQLYGVSGVTRGLM